MEDTSSSSQNKTTPIKIEPWQWERAYINKEGYAVVRVNLKHLEIRRLNYLIEQLCNK